MFFISFAVSLVQHSVPDCLSISCTYFTLLETRIPNLCDVLKYLDFILEITLSQKCRVSLIHHMKASSSLMSFSAAYSYNSTGLECISSFKGTRSTDPSLRSTNIFQPRVFFLWFGLSLLDLINPFTFGLGPAQDVTFFYTRSHLSELQSCALVFSTNF